MEIISFSASRSSGHLRGAPIPTRPPPAAPFLAVLGPQSPPTLVPFSLCFPTCSHSPGLEGENVAKRKDQSFLGALGDSERASWCPSKAHLSAEPRGSHGADSAPQGQFGHVWRHIWLSRLGGGGQSATGIWRAEARDATQHPSEHRRAPPQRRIWQVPMPTVSH